MATQITNSQSANVKPLSAKTNQVEQYVNRQLVRTTWQLRVSDMIAAIIGLLAFVLAFFILVSIVDSWIWPLPVSGRVISLVTLLTGMAIICLKTIVPLSWRRINPQYAARMIEEAKPGFKNSLLNFLSLKRKNAEVKQAVLNEVTRKAARDLQTITVENSVDRSNVIRMGFVLVALATLAIVYSVVSPKNPWQSVTRVLAPVSKISKPAVVRISDVQPGDTDVFFGDRLKVTAQVDGRHEPDDVRLYYSTDDGQIADAWVPMQPGETGNQYVGRLTTGPTGIQQPLTYHVVARDGRSPDFNVAVRANPAISINSIKITPPKYTRLPQRTLEGQGEIQAPEGSRIDISATANLPIKVAYIELLQAQSESPDNDDFKVEEVEMQFDGKSATGHFVAMLNSKRTKPKFSHYRVRFRSADNFRNERPNVYPIQVIADLGPDVEIVKPRNREITLPVNQPLAVEVRAADLDFEISSVELQIDHQGTRLLDRNLPMNIRGDDGPKDNQRVTARMVIKPDDLNLEPGDRVIMFAKASDNRISPRNSLPEPNVSFTDNYTLIITDPITNPKQPEPDPEEADSPPNGDQANQEQQSRASDQNDDPDKQPRSDRQDDQQSSASDQPTPDEGTEGQSGDGNSGSPGSESQDNKDSTQSNGSSSESGSKDSQQPGDSRQPGNSGESNNAESDPQSDDQKQTQSSQQKDGKQKQSPTADDENRTSDASGNGQSNADEANEKAGGSKQSGAQDNSMDSQASSGGSQTGDGQPQDGVSGNRQSTDSNDGGQDRDSQADGADGLRDKSLSDGQQEPLRKDAPEGEQFDRLQDLLEKQREKNADPNNADPNNVDPNNADPNNADPNNDDANDNAQGKSQDQGQPENGNSPDKARGDNANESQVQEKQTGKGQSGNEPSQDGNPQDGQPDGGQTPDGQPDQRQTGDGKTNAQDQPQNDSSGGQNPSKEGQPASPEGAKTDKDLQNQTGESSPGSTENDDAQKNNDPPNENSNQPPSGQQSGNKPGDDDSPRGQSNDSSPSDNASKQAGTEPQTAGGQQPSERSPSQSQEPEKRDENTTPSPDSQSNGGNPGATSEPQTTSDPGNKSSRDSGSNSQGIGGSGGSSGVQQEDDSSDPVGDKANLDHARKATDLVLQKLDEQKFEPDPELLDQMNWTKEDLQNFLQRWQEMKQNARTGTPQAKQQYENALLSLGLDPQNDGRTVETRKDKLFGLSQDAAVQQAPAEFVDEFNEFLKSRNRARRK